MKRKSKSALIYITLALMALIAVFPLIYTVTNSFMGAAEFERYYGDLQIKPSARSPLHLIPDWLTLDGFKEVFISRPDYLMKFWSSMLLSGAIAAGQMTIAVLGGYAFARFRFPGRKVLFFIIILIMMLPLQVTLVTNYVVLDYLGLLGGYTAVILPGVFSAFGVFLMRQVMMSLPASIFEAAKIDGVGPWRMLWKICLPNCKAGLAALAVLCFADSWNMVEQPIVLLKDSNMYPLSVFLTQINSARPEIGFICGLLSILPVLLLFLAFKDEMIQGIENTVIN